MGKRQIAAMQTRARLVQAAEKLINENGFESVTISDIAAEADVAVGTFYTYFKQKGDVASEIAMSHFAGIQKKSEEFSGDVVEKLGVFLTESMSYIADSGLKMAQQWLKTVVDPKDTGGKEKLLYDLGVIMEILEAAVASGELSRKTPVEDLHRWIAAEYYGIVTCWCITDGGIDPTRMLDGYCRVQLKRTLAEYMK